MCVTYKRTNVKMPHTAVTNWYHQGKPRILSQVYEPSCEYITRGVKCVPFKGKDAPLGQPSDGQEYDVCA
jgi:hypothetical protein